MHISKEARYRPTDKVWTLHLNRAVECEVLIVQNTLVWTGNDNTTVEIRYFLSYEKLSRWDATCTAASVIVSGDDVRFISRTDLSVFSTKEELLASL